MATRRPGRRGAVAIAVVLAWGVGLALFARREIVEGPARRLAEAGLRIAPGAEYYVVAQNGAQIGYASSTIDTVAGGGFHVTEYLVADIEVGARTHRTIARSDAHLTRALALTEFSLGFEADSAQITVRGRVTRDSLSVAVAHAGTVVDSQRTALARAILLPTLLPLAVALGERPRVGSTYALDAFDPLALSPRRVEVRVLAESVLVVTDSAGFDPVRRRWRSAHRDTVRSWLIAADSLGGVRSWVDERGRMVQTTRLLGFDLTRTAFELAFEEWRRTRPGRATVAADRDVLETTAIAASRPLGARRLDRLRVRLDGVSLAGLDLDGSAQRLRGDTLTIERPPIPERAPYRLAGAGALTLGRDARGRMTPLARELSAALASEPLIQSRDPAIVALAERIAAGERDPRVVAERITRWVRDSLRKQVTVSVPSAVQVLAARAGDCNEHTQLFLALARAARIPARGAAGLALVQGKFYYHAWPEIWLGRWIPVDPTFGQFPADASHLRLVLGGMARQADMLRLMGQLRIDVLSAGP